MARKKAKKEPKQRNWTVQHVMKKGVRRHKDKKREFKQKGFNDGE